VQSERNDSKSFETQQHLIIYQLVKQHAKPPDALRDEQIFYSYVNDRFLRTTTIALHVFNQNQSALILHDYIFKKESRKLPLLKEVNPQNIILHPDQKRDSSFIFPSICIL